MCRDYIRSIPNRDNEIVRAATKDEVAEMPEMSIRLVKLSHKSNRLRVNYPANGLTNQLAFFAVPKGQGATLIRAGVAAAVIKTYRDTNIENANVVPTKLFKFVGISLAFSHLTEGAVTNGIDRDRIRAGSYLKFRVVDKDIMYLDTWSIPEQNPYIVASTTANNTTILATAGGGGSNVPMYTFPVPITLNPLKTWRLRGETPDEKFREFGENPTGAIPSEAFA